MANKGMRKLIIEWTLIRNTRSLGRYPKKNQMFASSGTTTIDLRTNDQNLQAIRAFWEHRDELIWQDCIYSEATEKLFFTIKE